MKVRVLWVLIVALAASIAHGWLHARRSPVAGPPPAPSKPARTAPASLPLPPLKAPLPDSPETGSIIVGEVLRDGRPALATVTARFLQTAPPGPCSLGSWTYFPADSSLFAGFEPSIRARTESGADGNWLLRDLGPGVFLFEASSKDGMRGAVVATMGDHGLPPLGPDGARARLRIVLREAGCVLRGRAARADGSPWTGFVVADHDCFLAADPAPVATTPDGRFEIAGLAPGIVRVFTLEPGRSREAGPLVLLPCADEVAVVVGRGLREFDGVVVDGSTGLPLPGASVTVESSGTLLTRSPRISSTEDLRMEMVWTDPNGRFRVPLPIDPHGMILLHVEAPDFLPGGGFHHVPDLKGNSLPEVQLFRAGSLSGRVLAADTLAPVPGVLVCADLDDPAEPRCRTDAGGRYRLTGLTPSPWRIVQAIGEDWMSGGLAGLPGAWERDHVEVSPGRETVKDILVVPAVRVRGRVLDAGGSGVAGMTVEAERADDSFGVSGMRDVSWIRDSAVDPTPIVTTADGSFHIRAIRGGGQHYFVARWNGVVVGAAGPYVPEAGIETVFDLHLPPRRRLAVRVEREGAGSVEGARVRIDSQFLAGRWTSLDVAATTGPDGVAVFETVPDVMLDIRASTPGSGDDESNPIQCGEGSEVTVIRLPPIRPTAVLSVEGIAVYEDGSPAENALVTTSQEGRRGGGWWDPEFGGLDALSSRTDARGRFRVGGLEEGECTLRVRGALEEAACSVEETVAAGSADVKLVLLPEPVRVPEKKRKVEVRILGPDGATVPAGRVRWESRQESAFESAQSSFKDGRVVIELPASMVSGDIRIEASHAADAEGNPLPLGYTTAGPFTAGDEPLLVRMQAERVVEGRVVDSAGSPLPGIRVSIDVLPTDPDSPWQSGTDLGAADTDAEGRFRFGQLGDGECAIDCYPDGYLRSETRVRPGGEGITIRLRKAKTVKVKVLDPDGRPVGLAMVIVGKAVEGRSDPETTSDMTLATGIASLRDLDPEDVLFLEVHPPDSRGDLLMIHLDAWKPADGDVRLARGHVLEVRVQDKEGRPLPRVTVECSGGTPTGYVFAQTTGEDGRVRFTRIPAGEVRITARLDEAVDDAPGVATVAAADSGRVDLTLDPGMEIRIHVANRGIGETAGLRLAARGETTILRMTRGDTGEFSVRGLRDGILYDAVITNTGRSRRAILLGIRAGGAPVEAALQDGMTIDGTVLAAEGDRVEAVELVFGAAGLIERDDCTPEGFLPGASFHFDGIPAGTWKVRVRVVNTKGVARFVTSEVEAGSTAEVDAR